MRDSPTGLVTSLGYDISSLDRVHAWRHRAIYHMTPVDPYVLQITSYNRSLLRMRSKPSLNTIIRAAYDYTQPIVELTTVDVDFNRYN